MSGTVEERLEGRGADGLLMSPCERFARADLIVRYREIEIMKMVFELKMFSQTSPESKPWNLVRFI